MARFHAGEPSGVAVQELEVLVRSAIFKPATVLVGLFHRRARSAAPSAPEAFKASPGRQARLRRGGADATQRESIIARPFSLARREEKWRPPRTPPSPAMATLPNLLTIFGAIQHVGRGSRSNSALVIKHKLRRIQQRPEDVLRCVLACRAGRRVSCQRFF